MWRFCVCVVALVTTPALAQGLRYSGGERGGSHQAHAHGRHGKAHRPIGNVEPSHLGPAPIGFWYRCDLPAGYYPYIPTCQTPWRIVPSAPSGPFR